MSTSIACCYLTHNHPDVVDEVLLHTLENYIAHNIDVYIFDSSAEYTTKDIVEKYQKNYPDNLFYVDVRFVKTGDEKMLYVLQGNGLSKKYDYIWPSKDRCFFRGQTLDQIIEAANEGHDVILGVNEYDRWELRIPPVKDIYTDPVEFFGHYGQLCTNWEALIRKVDTMIDGVNWPELIKDNNLVPENPFIQPVSLFASLAKKDNCRIKVVHQFPHDKLCSKKAASGWGNVVFEIWIDKWIPAIFGLPAIYDGYKLAIIKSELGLEPLFGSTSSLIYLKDTNQLTKERYNQLKSIWNMITEYPEEYLDRIWNGEITELLESVIKEFKEALANCDFDKAHRVFITNEWLELTMDKKDYQDLRTCFAIYRSDVNLGRKSFLFDKTTSAAELLQKYRLENSVPSQSNDEKAFTTIIVITPKDFPRLVKHYKRMVENIPSKNILFVSGNGIEEELKKANLGDNVGFINENDLLTFEEVNKCMTDHLKHILGDTPVPRGATGWYYQQFLKMQYAYACKDKYYMTWDGDTIPCKPFSMFQEDSGAPYMDLKHEYHALYFETLEKILPGMKKCIGQSFISEHMLFNVDLMKQLIDKIESNDALKGTKFWEKIIYAIPPERISDSGFSEFETYGTFVAYTDPSLYKLRDWHSFRLAGVFFDPETICDRDFEWLSKDFHAISFEKGQTVREDNKNLFDNPEYQKKLSARQMLEIAQEEFHGGYIETWGGNNGQVGLDPLASNEPKESEYITYEKLGDSKIDTNINQAYLCYENAEFLCFNDEYRSKLKNKKEALLSHPDFSVKKAAICIVSYNCKEYLINCINSIKFHCAPGSYSIVIADNASTDGVREYLQSISESITLILNDENLGFPGGCNACIVNAPKDEDCFFLNNDTRMTHNALFWLRYGLYENDNIGATGCMGSFAGNEQMIDLKYNSPEDYMEYARHTNVPSNNPYEEKCKLCGFAMLVKRKVLDEVGLFDEAFAPGYFEDDDLSIRISEKGYRMLVVHNSFIYHKGSESSSKMQDVILKTVEKNYKYIIDKYGYNVFTPATILDSEKDTVASITHSQDDTFRFLEVNAGGGNFLSYLKYLYPNAEFIGTVKDARILARSVKNIQLDNIDVNKDILPYDNHSFDYIVVNASGSFADLTPEIAKEKLASLVKEGGKLLYLTN